MDYRFWSNDNTKPSFPIPSETPAASNFLATSLTRQREGSESFDDKMSELEREFNMDCDGTPHDNCGGSAYLHTSDEGKR